MVTPRLPGLDVKYGVGNGRKSSVRRYIRIRGINPGCDIAVHNHCIENLAQGVAERVLFRKGVDGVYRPTPKPAPGVFFARLGLFRRSLLRNLSSASSIALADVPGTYVGRKRVLYQNAVDSLSVSPLGLKDAHIRSFVKAEKADISSKGRSVAPRIIQPRSLRFNAVLGRHIKHLEKPLYDGIGKVWGSPVVAKGLNMLQQGNLIAEKWRSFVNPVAVGVDAKRFDQHVSGDALRWEHSIWNSWVRDPELRWLLRQQVNNNCSGITPEGRVRYTVEGCRMSGDMNTSSGNCLMMCSLVWEYSRYRGVRTELVNNGDDCTVMMERSDLGRFMMGFREWFLEMGFDMVVEDPVFEIEKIEFCQAHPVHIGDGNYLMVRNIKSTMAKDSAALVPFTHPECVSSWLASVGQCGIATYGGIPVLHEYYNMFCRSGKIVPKLAHGWRDSWWYLSQSAGLNRKFCEVLPETRLSFYIAFGITPDEQVCMEDGFKSRSIDSRQPRGPVLSFNSFQDAPQTIQYTLKAAGACAPTC